MLQKNQNLTVSSKTPDPPSAAILTVYLDRAQDLPVSSILLSVLMQLFPHIVEEPAAESFHSADFALPLHVICGILICGCSVGCVLMQMKKGNKDPSPMVQLSVQDTTKESKVSLTDIKVLKLCMFTIIIVIETMLFHFWTVYGTNNPMWEDAFTFFIQDPRKQDLDIQVIAMLLYIVQIYGCCKQLLVHQLTCMFTLSEERIG